MAKKSYYKPRPKKSSPPVKIEEEVQELIVEEQKEEIIVLQEPLPEELSFKEIPLVPVSATDFCKYKAIVGTNRDFLNKKYATKTYTLEVWEEILIKEKIQN